MMQKLSLCRSVLLIDEILPRKLLNLLHACVAFTSLK